MSFRSLFAAALLCMSLAVSANPGEQAHECPHHAPNASLTDAVSEKSHVLHSKHIAKHDHATPVSKGGHKDHGNHKDHSNHKYCCKHKACCDKHAEKHDGKKHDHKDCCKKRLDDDNDGVKNEDDKCPGSQPGQAIGPDGCPVPL